jgi:hypothetical protein
VHHLLSVSGHSGAIIYGQASSLAGNMATSDAESLTDLMQWKSLLYKFMVMMVKNIVNKLTSTYGKHAL